VVFKESFPKETNFLCDIGGELSEILVFKNGRLENVRVIPLGGGSITQMLCEGLKVPFELAEEIKISYGIAGEYLQRDEAKEILVKKDSAYKSISRKLVSEIVNAGVKTVCQNIKEAVQDIVNEGEASTFLFCGRSVLLEGFLEKMETTLELPVKIARINHPALIPVINQSDLVSVQKRLTYLTCLGIICQVLDRQYPGYYSATSPHRNPIIRLYSKIQEIFQEYF
jgi:cell division protein FtsA